MSELVPAGIYKAVAVSIDTEDGPAWAQFGEAGTGSKQVLLHFKILEGDWLGYQLPWFGYFTKDTTERTIKSLRLVGFRGDDLAELPAQRLDQTVSVTVEHQEYNNKTYARIAWVNAPGGGGVRLQNPMKGDKLRNFAAQMKRFAQQVGEVRGESASAPVTSTPPAQNGDIPLDKLPF